MEPATSPGIVYLFPSPIRWLWYTDAGANRGSFLGTTTGAGALTTPSLAAPATWKLGTGSTVTTRIRFSRESATKSSRPLEAMPLTTH